MLFFSLKRFVSFLLIASCVLTIVGCEEKRSALDLMNAFCSEYAPAGVIYSPSIKEGDEGFAGEDFFVTMYFESSDSVTDYAVFLNSNTEIVCECAVFLCYSGYDAMNVSEMLYRRIDFLKSFALAIDTSCAEDAFVLRKGKTIVMCAMPDNELAYSVWKRIIR